MIASGFSWFNIIPAIDQDVIGAMMHHPDYNVTVMFVSASMASVFVILFSIAGRLAIQRAMARPGLTRFEADSSFSLRTIVELFGTFIRNMMADCMPRHEVKHYSAYIGALFLYILFCNLQSLFPGLVPPTDNINANLGMGLASFLVFMWVGLSRDAVGFFKHLIGPMLVLAPLMLPLESLSLILRPITLALRLAGNMFGDHLAFTILSDLTLLIAPAILLVLATFVSFMQAFVFSLLSSVYVGLSLPHDDHH